MLWSLVLAIFGIRIIFLSAVIAFGFDIVLSRACFQILSIRQRQRYADAMVQYREADQAVYKPIRFAFVFPAVEELFIRGAPFCYYLFCSHSFSRFIELWGLLTMVWALLHLSNPSSQGGGSPCNFRPYMTRSVRCIRVAQLFCESFCYMGAWLLSYYALIHILDLNWNHLAVLAMTDPSAFLVHSMHNRLVMSNTPLGDRYRHLRWPTTVQSASKRE